MTQPAAIQLAVDQENPWYEVTLTEGRNRQIRRMFEQIGYHIEKIKRVRYGSLTLDVEPGEFRHLTTKEVNQLRKSMDTPFKPKPIKVKRKDDRPERRPRVDAARFVKGRRGKPSADAPVPAPMVRRGSFTRPPASPRREFSAPAGAPHLPQSADMGSPRGPEFSRPQFDRNSARRDDGFAAKRPYTRKPAGEFSSKPSGDFAERPKRTYAKPAGSFDRKPGSFDRKPSGDFAKREGGREGGYVKRPSAKREGGFGGAPEKRTASGTDGFGFSKFAKPKFVKPSKHRDLGSDKTENFEHKPLGESKPFGERKPFDAQRPYSKPAGDRSFDKKPGGFTSDRKYSKGPGKPAGYAPRSGGDYKPRSGGSSDFKRPGGDFKRSGEGRPGGRPGGFGKSAGPGRSSSGGAGGRPSGGSGFGAKRTGFGPPRSGSGGARRPSGPPRRRPDSE
jgi:23S rRNA pseudouridine2605 synthase